MIWSERDFYLLDFTYFTYLTGKLKMSCSSSAYLITAMSHAQIGVKGTVLKLYTSFEMALRLHKARHSFNHIPYNYCHPYRPVMLIVLLDVNKSLQLCCSAQYVS